MLISLSIHRFGLSSNAEYRLSVLQLSSNEMCGTKRLRRSLTCKGPKSLVQALISVSYFCGRLTGMRSFHLRCHRRLLLRTAAKETFIQVDIVHMLFRSCLDRNHCQRLSLKNSGKKLPVKPLYIR